MLRGVLGTNPSRDYWSATLSIRQSVGRVLADVGLEEGPCPELFHGEWPNVLGGQFT
jgi:hypothetical protein